MVTLAEITEAYENATSEDRQEFINVISPDLANNFNFVKSLVKSSSFVNMLVKSPNFVISLSKSSNFVDELIKNPDFKFEIKNTIDDNLYGTTENVILWS